MHKINDIVVKDGQIVLSHLPFRDGEHVHVTVTEAVSPPARMPISQVRELLRGKVRHFADPADPMIPEDSWEMHT
jgi:hypothetical protein